MTEKNARAPRRVLVERSLPTNPDVGERVTEHRPLLEANGERAQKLSADHVTGFDTAIRAVL